jgi:hypothetical protein
MKRWSLYLILLLFLVVGLAVYPIIVKLNWPTNLAEIWTMVDQSKKIQSDAAKQAEETVVSQEVLELRQRHQLRPLTESENGKKPQNVPGGTYGFSMCGVASLSAKRNNESLLEIHKHLDGIVYYVGYASKDEVEKYLARKNNFHILASPYSRDKSSLLFEIPIDFVSKCEARPVKDGHIFDFFVTAIPELYS